MKNLIIISILLLTNIFLLVKNFDLSDKVDNLENINHQLKIQSEQSLQKCYEYAEKRAVENLQTLDTVACVLNTLEEKNETEAFKTLCDVLFK